jgi:hypothetical protein
VKRAERRRESRAGTNDVRELPPGVYFTHEDQQAASHKLSARS